MASPHDRTLQRVLSISSKDGWSVCVVAGLSVLISSASASWVGTITGLFVVAGGVIELRGNRRLRRHDIRGVNALVAAQLLILATIWVYSLRNIVMFDEARTMAEIGPMLRLRGIDPEAVRPLAKPLVLIIYGTVIGVTLLFQGGLALYYHTRRARLRAAFAARDTPPPLPPAVPPTTFPSN